MSKEDYTLDEVKKLIEKQKEDKIKTIKRKRNLIKRNKEKYK